MTSPPSASASASAAQDAGEPKAADRGDPALPSMVAALVADRERVEQARHALQDAGDVPTWARRFGLLGDENRLKILLALHRAPGITVGGLADAVGMSENAVSHALSGLRLAGVVAAVRDGRFRRWTVTDADVHDILHAAGGSHAEAPTGSE